MSRFGFVSVTLQLFDQDEAVRCEGIGLDVGFRLLGVRIQVGIRARCRVLDIMSVH